MGRLAGLTGLVWLFRLCFLATALLLATARDRRWSNRDRRLTALLVCGWTAAVLVLLVDAQVGHRLYFSVVMADQSYRIAFTDAVARTGLPPANPLYFAGAPAPMRYFYLWYVLCAAAMQLAHVSARQAFTASSAWAGFGLLTTTWLYTTHFLCWKRPQRWLTLGLLLVTGADLVPALGQAILQPTLNGNTEWWSVDPIFGWPDSLLWVPHHVASVLCCLLSFLLLWQLQEPLVASPPISSGLHPRRALSTELPPILIAGCAFASAFGLSVYVAFGFTLLVVAWFLRIWFLHHPARARITRHITLAALSAALLAAPFVHELVSGPASSTSNPAPRLFTLSVRRMIDSELLTGLPLFASLNRAHPVLLDQVLRLLLLLPGLAMELGLYGAVLVLFLLARGRQSHSQIRNLHAPLATALFFAICGLVMTMFISSSVITNNDFGYRAVLLPQFFLLLLTAELLGAWRFSPTTFLIPPTPARRRLLFGLLILGLSGTANWALLLRAWLPIEAAMPQSGFTSSPADEFQIRQVFDRLDRVAPPNAVIAFRSIDPVADRKGAVMTPNEYYQRMLVMDAGRQLLNAEAKCAIHFGGDPTRCHDIQTATAQLYASPFPDADAARQYCLRFGVHFLLLGAWDPQWQAHRGWPANLPAVAREPRFQIFRCSP